MCNVKCDRVFRKTGDKIPCCKCYLARTEEVDEHGTIIVTICEHYECKYDCGKVEKWK